MSFRSAFVLLTSFQPGDTGLIPREKASSPAARRSSRLQDVTATVPVGLDPGMAPSPQSDLQKVGQPAGGSTEPEVQAGRTDLAEPRQTWRRCRSRVQVSRASPAAHPRVSRPHPQPTALLANELRRVSAHIHAHACRLAAPRHRDRAWGARGNSQGLKLSGRPGSQSHLIGVQGLGDLRRSIGQVQE